VTIDTTNVATLYLLFGGSDPLSREALEGALAPTLTQTFAAYDHGTLNYLTPTWSREYDTDGTLLGYNVAGGALDGIAAQNPYPYLTGFLWHLFSKVGPIDYAGARSQLAGEPRQSIEDSGQQQLQLSLVPYGTRPSGYRNWPTMPPLPVLPSTPAPTPKKKSDPWWLLGLSLAILLARHR
jgi:hypothetical protein